MQHRSWSRALGAGWGILLLAAVPVSAGTWQCSSGGDVNTSACWAGGEPNGVSPAFFNLGGTYTVAIAGMVNKAYCPR